jgi:putative aldouronate transport system substrate-binding protein
MVVAIVLSACGATPAVSPPANTPAAAPTAAASAPTSAPAPAAEPTAAAPAAEPTSAAAATTPVDIELWSGASVTEAGPPPDDWSVYQIARDKLGINLKIVLEPSALNDQDAKINAAAAADALPDLFQVNRDIWFRLVENGQVAKVDDLLPQMPQRTKTHYNDENRNKLVTIDGAMYGLPEPGALPHTDGLVIRKDWLDTLGLQAPKTLDEFLTVAKAFTEKDPDGNGQNDTYGYGAYIEGTGLLNLGLGQRFDWIYGAYGAGGVWDVSSAQSFGLQARKPNFLKATQFVKSLIDAKVVDPDWPTLKKDEYRARWKQGKYGIMHENFCALACTANYKDFDTNFPNGEFMVLPPPAGPDGQSAEGSYAASSRIYAVSQQAIDAGKGPAIARLLEWMASDEGYYLIGFGQEGVNFKRDANGFVTTEGIPPEQAWSAKEQQPLTQLRNLVFINTDVELKARYITFKTKSGRTQDPLAFWQGFDKQPWVNTTAAAIINPPANSADFTRFYSENMVKFVLGQQPLDEPSWTSFVAGLDGLGAKDLEASAKETLTTSGFLK